MQKNNNNKCTKITLLQKWHYPLVSLEKLQRSTTITVSAYTFNEVASENKLQNGNRKMI
jgi:hypothetical protein